MINIRHFGKSEKGSLVAELSVILPLIIFIIAGGMILILALWSKIVVVDAAREGARYEALNYGNAEVKVDEVLQAGNLNVANKHSVTVTKDTNYITVMVKYRQPAILPLLPQLLGGAKWGDSSGDFILESSQVFKIEKPE